MAGEWATCSGKMTAEWLEREMTGEWGERWAPPMVDEMARSKGRQWVAWTDVRLVDRRAVYSAAAKGTWTADHSAACLAAAMVDRMGPAAAA